MTRYREILRLYSQGISQRSIALSCECSRNTVAKVIASAKQRGINWPLKDAVTDGEIEDKLFGSVEARNESGRKMPDLEYMHTELAKRGITLRLLWDEYCLSCRNAGEQPLMYSQFCYHYQKYAQTKRATMHIPRKPGEQIEVDWAGQTMLVVDRDSGETSPAYIFVGVLSYSGYAYVEACTAMDQSCWITAHVEMFRYFGGSARILIPDNLKASVDHTNNWYTPQINRTYHEMAEHYNTAVIPARVRKPKDKPAAEGTVGVVSAWIIAALRNRKFFSIEELNRAVHEKLEILNTKQFQKKEGSRRQIFLDEEKVLMQLLPAAAYELAVWKKATVQFNYHIAVEKMMYSVPNEYIKQQVDVRLTKNVVEVFYQNHRICSHQRLYGRPNQYSTDPAHMPEDHQKYISWNSERFISWAASIGPNAEACVRAILMSFKVEQQGYRSCMGLLKLAGKYTSDRLEAACAKILEYTPRPSLKSIQTILVSGQDQEKESPTPCDKGEQYGFTRGASYYERKGH